MKNDYGPFLLVLCCFILLYFVF